MDSVPMTGTSIECQPMLTQPSPNNGNLM